MALAKKCDICGKMYTSYNSHNPNKNKPNSIHMCSMDIDNSRFYRHYQYDLCPECMKAFKEFIESRGGTCEIDI